MARINSTNIDDMRPSEAKNIHKLEYISNMCKFPFGASCTYRNQEEQTYLAQTQGAPKTVTFHGARLAIDVFQNVKGHAYDAAFYDFIAPIAKKMGFTWMQDITKADKPHFQNDALRTYTNKDILAGRLPPPMAEYPDSEMYKDIIQYYCKFSDPAGVWAYLDKHPFALALYKKWAESYA
jgi:hypothetical protein